MVRILLRAARMDEADLLGELALRSKAHWGYDQNFLDGCRAELTFRPEEIPTRRIVLAESAGRVLGFYSVDGDPPEGELGNLWVDPELIGSGVGRRLWRHAIDTAHTAGFAFLRIEADPYAEGFYLAMGAHRVGETPSGSIPGRILPLLRYSLAQRAAAATAPRQQPPAPPRP